MRSPALRYDEGVALVRIAQMDERPCIFSCGDEVLVGIVHRVQGNPKRGVLFVVGGPQYRAGSHRQFVLLARYLAERGHPSMRFDARGMGDSSGRPPGFEAMNRDIAAAIEGFVAAVPNLQEFVLWGLCDGASAAVLYAAVDPRVVGLVLVNPWVRTESLEARARVSGYYGARIREPSFWRALARGQVAMSSIAQAVDAVRRAVRCQSNLSDCGEASTATEIPQLMAAALERFRGGVLVVLSGRDLTAKEFVHLCASDARWQRLMAREAVSKLEIPDANHTFSRTAWRDSIATATHCWLQALPRREQ